MSNGDVLIIVGAIAIIYGLYCLFRLIAVHNWPSVEGAVITSARALSTTDAGKMEDAEIRYEYSVDGKRYTSSVINAGGDLSNRPSKREKTEVDRLLGTYPVGRQITVFYNPKIPRMACLERNRADALFICLVFGPLAVIVGYFFID